jgi:hypothetical protein
MSGAERVARQCMALVLVERSVIIEALNALGRGDAARAERLLRDRESTWIHTRHRET